MKCFWPSLILLIFPSSPICPQDKTDRRHYLGSVGHGEFCCVLLYIWSFIYHRDPSFTKVSISAAAAVTAPVIRTLTFLYYTHESTNDERHLLSHCSLRSRSFSGNIRPGEEERNGIPTPFPPPFATFSSPQSYFGMNCLKTNRNTCNAGCSCWLAIAVLQNKIESWCQTIEQIIKI